MKTNVYHSIDEYLKDKSRSYPSVSLIYDNGEYSGEPKIVIKTNSQTLDICIQGKNVSITKVSSNVTTETYYGELNGETITIDEVAKNDNIIIKGIIYSLDCIDGQSTSIVMQRNCGLSELDCSGNQLTTLDVGENSELRYLDCQRNNISTLDVSKCAALTDLGCNDNGDILVIFGENHQRIKMTLECGDDNPPSQEAIARQVNVLPRSGGSMRIFSEEVYNAIPQSVFDAAEERGWSIVHE